jgi:hypothetical protein
MGGDILQSSNPSISLQANHSIFVTAHINHAFSPLDCVRDSTSIYTVQRGCLHWGTRPIPRADFFLFTYLYRALSSLSSSGQIFQVLLDHYLLEKGKWPQFHICSLDITLLVALTCRTISAPRTRWMLLCTYGINACQ